jgi:ferritin-like metal-binding protein YciE
MVFYRHSLIKNISMAQLIDLRDLLKHEILDLYSAEEQIIEALPKMVDKATNVQLKKALGDHLKITEAQKNRLDQIKGLMSKDPKGEDFKDNKGFFSKLFGGSGGEKCKGTEGLIKEGEKMMGEDMTAQVMDAAIIGAAQKIEHYEISGYGTAVAYARELGLTNVAGLLK